MVGTALDRLEILVGQFELAPPGQSAEGLGRAAGPDEETVGRPVGEILADTVLKPGPRPEHDHQHEDAPEHTKGGQRRAQLVGRQ